MTAQCSDDSNGTMPMSSHAWRQHVVALLLDRDPHCRLLTAPARRSFAGARRHVMRDPDVDTLAARWEADRA